MVCLTPKEVLVIAYQLLGDSVLLLWAALHHACPRDAIPPAGPLLRAGAAAPGSRGRQGSSPPSVLQLLRITIVFQIHCSGILVLWVNK